MKFSIKQPDLAKALSIVGKIITGRNTLPVLDNVLIEAKEGSLQFTTTSLEVSITHNIEANIKTEGRTTIPVNLIQNYVSLISSNEEIDFELKDSETVHLSIKNSKTDIKTINAEEFPNMPTVKKEKEIIVKASILSPAIDSVAFATSTDQIRPVLTGVYFKSIAGKLTLAGTDSYRLAEKKIDLEKGSDDLEVIIPARFANEASRIFSETAKKDENIKITLSRHQLVFEGANTTFVARNIEGRFPPYQQIIPDKTESNIVLDVEEASRDIRRSALFTSGGSIKVTFEKEGINVTSTSQEGSENAFIKGKTSGKDKNDITINAAFLLDILSHVKTKSFNFGMNEQNMPALVRPDGDDNYSYVIMPVNPQ